MSFLLIREASDRGALLRGANAATAEDDDQDDDEQQQRQQQDTSTTTFRLVNTKPSFREEAHQNRRSSKSSQTSSGTRLSRIVKTPSQLLGGLLGAISPTGKRNTAATGPPPVDFSLDLHENDAVALFASNPLYRRG